MQKSLQDGDMKKEFNFDFIFGLCEAFQFSFHFCMYRKKINIFNLNISSETLFCVLPMN